MSDDKLSSEAMDEIYSFIVDSNLEHALINQLTNKKVKKELKSYFQI